VQKLFFSLFFCGKSLLSGLKKNSSDSSKKKGTPKPSFLDILASFGVKNVCVLFREIE